MGRSAEQDFFESAVPPSDHPVSLDTDAGSHPADLEGREQRRARFTRLVGGIIGVLGVGSLLALIRPGSSAPQAERVAAAHVVKVESAVTVPAPMPEAPARVPPPLPETAAIVPAATEATASVSTVPAPAQIESPSASAASRKAVVAASPAPRARVAPLRLRPPATKPAATSTFVSVDRDRPPPTARFAD